MGRWMWVWRAAWLVPGLLLACTAAQASSAPEGDQPFYLTLDTPPAPVRSPTEAMDTFALAPGFALHLHAAEPLVEDPVAIAWDEFARLYVVEMRGYMPDEYGRGEDAPVGAVVRLDDADGDGALDTRHVLLDGLVLPRAVRVVNEGLLVAEPPNLWLCPSRDGDARTIDCAQKRSLGSYGDQPGSVEHAENGLLIGLDNWLYSAKSDRRLRLTPAGLVSEPTLFRGQWGITRDNDGRLYYNTNSRLLLGDGYDAQSLVRAGIAGAPGLKQNASGDNEVFSVRVNPGVNRAYLPGVLRDDGRLKNPTSASGMSIYRGGRRAFGDGVHAFVAEPAANAVAHLRLTFDALATSGEHVVYPDTRWGEREFMASTDERFRPVDVVAGPDGALYVVDFYRGIIQDHVFLSEELRAQALARGLHKPLGRGRIWRITGIDEPHSKAQAPGDQQPEQWLDALTSPNGWRRDTAQRLLQGPRAAGSTRIDDRLRDMVREAPGQAAVHALWTLEGRGTLLMSALHQAIGRWVRDPSPAMARVAEAALLAGGARLPVSDLLALETTPGSRLHLYRIAALAAHNNRPEVLALLLARTRAAAATAAELPAVQAALVGAEPAFVDLARAQGVWDEEAEAAKGLLGKLVGQHARRRPEHAGRWLALVEKEAEARPWLARSVLEALAENARQAGFQRYELPAAHALFAAEASPLWPSLARARRAFTWAGDDLPAAGKPLNAAQRARRKAGAEFYDAHCANCHGADGGGADSLGPPLAGSAWVTGAPERLVNIVLHGLAGPVEVLGETWNGAMPGHGHLMTDATLAGLATHLRRSWGHAARAVDPAFVAALRTAHADRVALWTADALNQEPLNTHYREYAGTYGNLRITYDGQALVLDAGIFQGPMRETREDHFLYEDRAMAMEFLLDDAGAVTGLRLQTDDGPVVLPRRE